MSSGDDEPFDENAPLRATAVVAGASQDWDLQPEEPQQVDAALPEPETDFELESPAVEAVETDAPATPEQADVVDEADPEEPVPAPAPEVAAAAIAPEPAPDAPTAVHDVLSSVPKWPENPTWPPTSLAAAAAPAPTPATRVPAGAYLPPSAVLPPGDSLPIANGATSSAAVAGVSTAVAPASTPSLASRFRLGDADGPLGLPDDAPARTIAAGAGIAAFSLILPWAEIVIGSRAMGSYIDSWGLAGPGHALVLLALLGVAAIALAADRLPRWVGAGLPAIVLAAFIAGIAWPYLIGPFRPAIGVYVVVVGALILGVGGLLSRAGQRHAEPSASV